MSAAAGRTVYEATIEHQGWGDPAAMLARLRSELPAPDDADTAWLVPAALFYRVLAGDPTGDHVVVSLLADTGQARTLGGLSRVDLTLRWLDGDWRLRLPTPGPSRQPGTAGYTPLGVSS